MPMGRLFIFSMIDLNEYVPEGCGEVVRGGIYEQFSANSSVSVQAHDNDNQDDGREQFCYIATFNIATKLWDFGMAFVSQNSREYGFEAFEENLAEKFDAIDLLREWDSAQFFKVANNRKIHSAQYVENGLVGGTMIIVPPEQVNGSYLNDLQR